MKQHSLVVVILNYRTAVHTLRAVESLLLSERKPDRIWVIDNGSGESEIETLRRQLPFEVQLIASPENLGFSGGCNLGIEAALHAGAESVFLANSDLTLAPDTLGRLEETLWESPDTGIVGPAILDAAPPHRVQSLGIAYSRLTGRMRHQHHGALAVPGGRKSVVAVDGLCGCALLVRADVFASIGLLLEDYFFTFEDLDFCLRAQAAGFRVACDGRATVHHEGGASSSTFSRERLYFSSRNHLLLSRRFGPSLAIARAMRGWLIAALSASFVLWRAPGRRLQGLAMVCRGILHHLQSRYGAAPKPEHPARALPH